MVLSSCDQLAQEAPPARDPKIEQACEWKPFGKIIVKDCSRPQMCAHLSTPPDPDTWDPVTETYPTNEAWEECMGVGRRD